ncbi:phytase [Sphingomonas sp. PB2P19]|uniref:phytase n=1 Tax=Sphingomonas rhamnosi TaxID=3096156 RepID=UPI002FCBA9F2
MRRACTTLLATGLLAGCAALDPASVGTAPIVTGSVVARGETAAVGTLNADAADDPAIWRNPRDPAASLIVATDKRAGLHVYGLDGTDRSFVAEGRLNNVDLKDMGGAGIIVAASDRADKTAAMLALYRLDPKTARLTPLGKLPVGVGEAYGACLYREAGRLYAFNVLKDGTVVQLAIQLTGAAPTGTVVRTLKLATQSEGCVADERTHRVYIAEEDVGVWRFDSRAAGPTDGHKMADADGKAIVADTEGLTLAAEGRDGGYLIVSSQGDNAYAVYSLRDERFAGRFRIAAGAFGSTEETDGVDIAIGAFGPNYPGGLFVAQDGQNAPHGQNFKLVAWRDIKRALGLR